MLNYFLVGTPCLACFSLDNCWYRAFILNIRYGAGGQTVIGVHFVDYGNTEYVTAERFVLRSRRFPIAPGHFMTNVSVGIKY